MTDKDAYIGRLYAAHRQELKKFVCAKFNLDSLEGDDLVQAVFTKFYGVPDLMDIANPRAYLFRIAQNYIIDHKRSLGREVKVLEDITYVSNLGDDSLHDPSRICDAQQKLDIIKAAVLDMSEKKREILRLSRHEHLSNVEIAKRLGVSEAAIRKHISRAMIDIKRAIDAGNGEVSL